MNGILSPEALKKISLEESSRKANGDLTDFEKKKEAAIQESINKILETNADRIELINEYLSLAAKRNDRCTEAMYFSFRPSDFENILFVHDAVERILYSRGYKKLQPVNSIVIPGAWGNSLVYSQDKAEPVEIDIVDGPSFALKTCSWYESYLFFFRKKTEIRIYFAINLEDIWE